MSTISMQDLTDKARDRLLEIARDETLTVTEQAKAAGLSRSGWQDIRNAMIRLGMIPRRNFRPGRSGLPQSVKVLAAKSGSTYPSANVPVSVLRHLGAQVGDRLTFIAGDAQAPAASAIVCVERGD